MHVRRIEGMETVLHIEKISRAHNTPIAIGDTEHIFFGNGEFNEEDNVGSPAAHIRLGAPLEMVDMGNTQSTIPLVKTFEYTPDFNTDGEFVFSETIHYLTKDKYLIPCRTKLRSGKHSGSRFTHLPSLNHVRYDLTGDSRITCDPTSEIVDSLLKNDNHLRRIDKHPIVEWVRDDLSPTLSRIPTTSQFFNPTYKQLSIDRFKQAIIEAPYGDLSTRYLASTASILTHSPDIMSLRYTDPAPIMRSVIDLKNTIAHSNVDLRSYGKLKVDHLNMVVKNPTMFGEVIDFLDNLPLTDVNVELILADSEIVHSTVHAAADRFSVCEGNNSGIMPPLEILEYDLTPDVLLDIVSRIVQYHPMMTQEIADHIVSHPIKIKIVKTILDESVILIYPYNSGPQDPPLCGVYFDIACLSLAPMSIVPGYCG